MLAMKETRSPVRTLCMSVNHGDGTASPQVISRSAAFSVSKRSVHPSSIPRGQVPGGSLELNEFLSS